MTVIEEFKHFKGNSELKDEFEHILKNRTIRDNIVNKIKQNEAFDLCGFLAAYAAHLLNAMYYLEEEPSEEDVVDLVIRLVDLPFYRHDMPMEARVEGYLTAVQRYGFETLSKLTDDELAKMISGAAADEMMDFAEGIAMYDEKFYYNRMLQSDMPSEVSIYCCPKCHRSYLIRHRAKRNAGTGQCERLPLEAITKEAVVSKDGSSVKCHCGTVLMPQDEQQYENWFDGLAHPNDEAQV